jgi:sortase (surface protein transpeptidase)
MRDGHHESRRHAVPGGVSEEDGETAVGQGREIVEIPAYHVGDPAVRGELEARDLRHGAGEKVALQLPGEHELVAEVRLSISSSRGGRS